MGRVIIIGPLISAMMQHTSLCFKFLYALEVVNVLCAYLDIAVTDIFTTKCFPGRKLLAL